MSPPKLGRFVGRSKTHRTYVPVFCWAVVFFSSFFCHGEIWGRPNFREKFQHLGEFYFGGLPSLKLVRTRKKWMVKRRGIRLPFLGPDTAYLFRWVNSLLVSRRVWLWVFHHISNWSVDLVEIGFQWFLCQVRRVHAFGYQRPRSFEFERWPSWRPPRPDRPEKVKGGVMTKILHGRCRAFVGRKPFKYIDFFFDGNINVSFAQKIMLKHMWDCVVGFSLVIYPSLSSCALLDNHGLKITQTCEVNELVVKTSHVNHNFVEILCKAVGFSSRWCFTVDVP